MKRTLATLLLTSVLLLGASCDGHHPDSTIHCWQETIGIGGGIVGTGGNVSGSYWVCTASYTDTEGHILDHKISNQYRGEYKACKDYEGHILDHKISNQYRGEYKACKDYGGQLITDLTVTKKEDERGRVTKKVSVSKPRCSKPPPSSTGF